MKFLRFLLFPFAVIYDLVATIRNFLFDVRFFNQTSFSIPVIVVGNLSVGGIGKTPQIEYLIRLLKNQFKIAVLSRGYKRETTGFLTLNSNHTAIEVGDEPLQFFRKFQDIIVAVDANRVEGIKKILQQSASEIVLLDDAFQHRKVKGSFYILLTKFDDLFVSDYLLPTGNLRENRTGAKRADAIIVSKCPEDLTENQKEIIRNSIEKYSKNVYFSSISYAKYLSGNEPILLKDLRNYEVLLLTGIANSSSLLHFLKSNKVNYHHLNFPDHYQFSSEDIDNILFKFDTLKGFKKIILTTEKDFVRLNSLIKNCYFIEIETSFLECQKVNFDNLILDHINSFSN